MPQEYDNQFQANELIDLNSFPPDDASVMGYSQGWSDNSTLMSDMNSSWQYIGSPSGYTDSINMGGYEMALNNSSQSSASRLNGASSGSYSPPRGSPEAGFEANDESRPWIPVAEYRVDTEAMAIDHNFGLQGMDSQQHILFDLKRPGMLFQSILPSILPFDV